MRRTGVAEKVIFSLGAFLLSILLFVGCQPFDEEIEYTFDEDEWLFDEEEWLYGGGREWPFGYKTTVSRHGGPLILAHWMPWYQGPRVQSEVANLHAYGAPSGAGVSGHWGGWGRYNPTLYDERGRSRIAARQYPLTGPYHSGNVALLEYQASLMIIAGIDGVIIDWYGVHRVLDFGFNHDNTVELVNVFNRANLNFLIMYEDNTLNMMEGHFDSVNNPAPITQQSREIGRMSFDWAQENWFNNPLYVRFEGRPVVLCFGPQHFRGTRANWNFLFDNVFPRPFFGDIDNRYPWADTSFNWPPMHLSQMIGGRRTLTEERLIEYLQNFYGDVQSTRPFRIATVFSAFDDSYAVSLGYLAYNYGETFRLTWDMAMEFEPHIIQIATWNDYGEGTIIEPTIERGYNELEFIQDRVREWDSNFPFTHEDLRWPLEFYRLRFTQSATPAQEAAINDATDALFRRDAEAFRAAAERTGLTVDVNDLRPILRGRQTRNINGGSE
ncbi:MAG: hypothetical protein FWB78_02395 [Treponema sp.]|nr:hypothetical protein [Treponema sp.]